MKELKAAFPRTIPVLAGYVFLGITYGILMETNGFPLWLPILTACVVYTGSMEFLLVGILLSPFNPWATLATTLMVGARHIFYGLAMLNRYRGTGKAKYYLIFSTSDETFALNCDADIPPELDKTKYYVAVSVLDQSYWVAGTAIGALCGQLISFNTEGLDFVMTAMFVCIFLNQWLKDNDILKANGKRSTYQDRIRIHAPEIIGAGSSLLCLLLFGPERFIVPSMFLILLVLTLCRKQLEPEKDPNEQGGIVQ
ncbi:AzlC family ABC transporter permease [Catenisphaera adipataccumulans]|jgi:4-azaleucine resistance transporter AzlC|uniref:4-azaleucine resistance transporter AzlC n=1 Tax=Catenisphaera adipataccumulans TaxID=700500 RepID=A0A7W8CY24_9FIRM|nr:AzlC family ABC transporter permease [Catenisphaera adipataccumulans]MBB5183717.1 4-azaleucine resistance transporter AzlC [Catenisphaera adipataccumulans]